jgi:hypothetical protein
MAKQTINIGAAPNDGTGTPLRTSFDYCNQNFTELYTATGPSGNNIVVPGSATITGDLTVDTSTLKVDSANNRVGIGTASPSVPLEIYKASGDSKMRITSGSNTLTVGWDDPNGFYYTANTALMAWQLSTGTAMTLNSTGLGVGGSPIASHFISAYGPICVTGTAGGTRTSYISNANTGSIYYTDGGASYPFDNFGNLIIQPRTSAARSVIIATGSTTPVERLIVDPSGNLLVGTTSGTSHNLRKQGTTVEGDTHLNVGNAEHLFFACSSVTYNAAAAAYKITRNSSTLRSINAGGTINASGADYAEYMVKCGDFVLAKGDVAGIDANGKLTNVFADAISFVVKSTDPSYVGNDKWGVDLEGDALETARQLVDRIAFAGQVPVNVTGATAGDYIVPVVDGTGIKGISVSNPTFEQYKLAVGKVIAIDADGRARIIVKVA